MRLKRSALLGGFIIVVLTGLTIVAVVLADFKPPWEKRRELTIYFGEGSVIEEGSQVLSSGIRVGLVKRVSLLPPDEIREGRYVKAVLSIKNEVKGEPFPLWKGSHIVLARATILGRHQVHLFRGNRDEGPLETDVIDGRVASGVIERLDRGEPGALGKLLLDSDAYASLNNTINDLDKEGTLLYSLVRDNTARERFEKFLDLLEQAGEDYKNNEGPLKLLLGDNETSEKIKTTIADLSAASKDVKDAFENLKTLAAAAGDKDSGTILATLIYDQGQGKRFRETLEKLERDLAKIGDAAAGLGSSDSVAGYLLNDPEARRRFETIVRNLSDPHGGTLGRLINDDTVVRDLEAMLQEFTEAGRVARENAPLGNLVSFTALFFSILN